MAMPIQIRIALILAFLAHTHANDPEYEKFQSRMWESFPPIDDRDYTEALSAVLPSAGTFLEFATFVPHRKDLMEGQFLHFNLRFADWQERR